MLLATTDVRVQTAAIPPCARVIIRYLPPHVGLWRSLVARPSGGRKVAGSSPASPTITQIARTLGMRAFVIVKGATP